ncbi:MAG: J domain-containing protein [Tissierellales bacterium]|nr:J domain-containing protein [Tissierellales bacterium]
MNFFKNLAGKVIYGIAKAISYIFDFFIWIFQTIVNLIIGLGRILLTLIAMGGILVIFLLFSPIGIALLFNPITIIVITLFIVIPILGKKFISYLQYLKYIVTEYLFDLSKYLTEEKAEYKSFNEYGKKYRHMEEERERKEREERQRREREAWEERFRQWQEYQSYNRGYQGYYQNTSGQYNGTTYQNPATEFISKYENSCKLLGLSPDTDIYQVKLAYRKKAKEYHPDLNKSPDATRKFQEINDAYEFLTEENIERYKNIKKGAN